MVESIETKKKRSYYSEEFKLTVLKDKYENNLSALATARKYGIDSSTLLCRWERKYPVDSKLLSLSEDVIEKVKAMQKNRKIAEKKPVAQTREEVLEQEIANLRKALIYSELRNEALNEVLKIGKEQYGIDLLKKVGAKQ